MRERFAGHFKQSPTHVNDIWSSASIAFDANVLLNLYRYSEETADDFMRLLESINSRVWLPEQAAFEYFKNRASVVVEQKASYAKAIESLEKIQSQFTTPRTHPFISKETKKLFDKSLDALTKELRENKRKQESLIAQDTLKDKLADIIGERIGNAYSDVEFDKITEEGSKRYNSHQPPEYLDGKKNKEPKNRSELRENFGDWIIWRQILDYSTNENCDLIFVTDDRKDDWWERVSGKTIGPRPELIQEFLSVTGRRILIYTPDSFLLEAKKRLMQEISKETINEIEEEQRARLARLRRQRLREAEMLIHSSEEQPTNRPMRTVFSMDPSYARRRLVADALLEKEDLIGNSIDHDSIESTHNMALLDRLTYLETIRLRLNEEISSKRWNLSRKRAKGDLGDIELLSAELEEAISKVERIDSEINLLKHEIGI